MTFDEILATQPKELQDMVAAQRAEARSGGQWGLFLKVRGNVAGSGYCPVLRRSFPTREAAEEARNGSSRYFVAIVK